MKYSEAKQGRTFILRLEDGDIIHEVVEQFACEHSIKAATLVIIGGADKDSKLITGLEQSRSIPIKAMEYVLDNVYEVTGTGTIFPDEKGNPILHMHISCGRNGSTVTGCIRNGVKVWQIMEVILFELIDTKAVRTFDSNTGFKLLQIQ
ncbi:MAG: DNA-binding protein [Desulfobacterales bacterium]|nr:DNA-binding protein [Desulfobacterales bacterium]